MSAMVKIGWIGVGMILGFIAGIFFAMLRTDRNNYYEVATKDIQKVTLQYLKNFADEKHSSNYRLLSESLRRHYTDSADLEKAVAIGEAWIDSGKILGITFLDKKKAHVLVKEFGQGIQLWNFSLVREDTEWKINDFNFLGLLTQPETTFTK